jgi:hypothetical protein
LRTLLLRAPHDEVAVAALLEKSRGGMERIPNRTAEQEKLLRLCRMACLLLTPIIDDQWDALCQTLGSTEECQKELWAGLPHLWGYARHRRQLLHTVYRCGNLVVLLELFANLVCDGSLPLPTAIALLQETREAYKEEAIAFEPRGFEERCVAVAMDRHPKSPVNFPPRFQHVI